MEIAMYILVAIGAIPEAYRGGKWLINYLKGKFK